MRAAGGAVAALMVAAVMAWGALGVLQAWGG